MQQLIPFLAFTIMTIGLITVVLGLIEFTQMLGGNAEQGSSEKNQSTPPDQRNLVTETEDDLVAAA